MKSVFYLSIFVALITLINSCCKTTSTPAPTEITFDVPFTDTGVFTDSIPQLPLALPLTYVFKAATGVEQGLAANNMSKQNVTSAKGEYLRIIIENPADQYFDFIDSMKILFSTLTDTATKVLVARKDVIPAGAQNLVMDVQDEELKNYLLQDSFYMYVKGTIKPNSIIKKGTRLRFNANFKVKGHL